MIFARATAIDLRKSFSRRLPFSKLLVAFLDARFNGAACRQIAEAAIREGADERLFRLDEFKRGGVVVSDEVLYPSADGAWCFELLLGNRRLSLEVEDQLDMVAAVLQCALTQREREAVDEFIEGFGDALLEFVGLDDPTLAVWGETWYARRIAPKRYDPDMPRIELRSGMCRTFKFRPLRAPRKRMFVAQHNARHNR